MRVRARWLVAVVVVAAVVGVAVVWAGMQEASSATRVMVRFVVVGDVVTSSAAPSPAGAVTARPSASASRPAGGTAAGGAPRNVAVVRWTSAAEVQRRVRDVVADAVQR